MTAGIQTLIALTVVAIAATWLVLRARARRKNPGCGGDCGCPAAAIKVKPGHGRPAA
jgi:hypothetical protein